MDRRRAGEDAHAYRWRMYREGKLPHPMAFVFKHSVPTQWRKPKTLQEIVKERKEARQRILRQSEKEQGVKGVNGRVEVPIDRQRRKESTKLYPHEATLIEQWNAGVPVMQIGRELGVTPETIRRYVKRHLKDVVKPRE